MEININQYLEKTYNTQRYLSGKATLWAFATFIFLSSLLIFLAVIFKTGGSFVFIGFAFLCITPFMFLQRFRKIFTRNVVVEFNSQSFLIKEYGLERGDLMNEFNCRWDDIKYYKCTFSGNKYTSLSIYLKDGVNKNYVFKDNKAENEAIQEESIFSIFYSYISRYNTDKTFNERIFLSPSFLATRLGAICIILLAILGVAAIIFQFSLTGKFLPLSSLMGFSMLLQLIMRRGNYKKTYNNIMKLGNDSHEINSNY